MIKTYSKDGKSIQYKIVIKKIKHTYLHFKDGLLVVTTNSRISNAKIIQIIDDKFNLIYRKINSKIKLNDNEMLLFGKTYLLEIYENSQFKYEIGDNSIVVFKSVDINLEHAINSIYEVELYKKIEELAPYVLQRIKYYQLDLVRHKIKNVKTYYGKCFLDKKEIVFALKLAKLDPIFLEYVMYHEYAHFIEPNHSQKFYKVLDKLMPNHRVINKKLKKIRI